MRWCPRLRRTAPRRSYEPRRARLADPGQCGRSLVDAAVSDEGSKATLRRLYRHPTSGALVAMESHSRCFPKGLAKFIGLRDLLCRTPYCDAPIRHRDHARPHNRGGPTSAINGLGECERCNYTKEAPGWRVSTAEENGVHSRVRDATGATYRSTAPPAPGPPRQIWVSEIETRIVIAIAAQHAA